MKAINLLGPQLKNTLLSLQLGTEHQFLDEIRSVSFEVSNKLESQVWIAEKIQDVPAEVHREFITRLSVENLFAVIYALPQHLRDYMLDCIPEGNRKTMTLDLLQRAEQQTTESQKKAAQQIARKYIEDLRQSHDVGNFKLKTQLRAAS